MSAAEVVVASYGDESGVVSCDINGSLVGGSLNVAQEITTFTNKQILVQAGISTLAQANQLPQNLLRLFA